MNTKASGADSRLALFNFTEVRIIHSFWAEYLITVERERSCLHVPKEEMHLAVFVMNEVAASSSHKENENTESGRRKPLSGFLYCCAVTGGWGRTEGATGYCHMETDSSRSHALFLITKLPSCSQLLDCYPIFRCFIPIMPFVTLSLAPKSCIALLPRDLSG